MSREIKFEVMFVQNTFDFKKMICKHYTTLDRLISGDDKFKYNQVDIIAKRQFTGLKDKNGVEIYDGDIVSLNQLNQVESSDIYFEVKWCNKNYRWIIYHSDVEFYDLADFDFWSIGNIHQNPELLS